MKKRHKFLLLVASLGLVLSDLLWYQAERGRAVPVSLDSKGVSAATPTSRIQSPQPSESANTPPAVQIEKGKQDRINAAFLTPISIFGKVLDEQRHPIPGATVQIAINDRPSRSGTEYVRSTDADGGFSLSGVNGISFSVRTSKTGFYTTKESTARRNVAIPAYDDVPEPTREKPLILTLRRQLHPEPLFFVSSRQIDLPSSGGPTIVDLVTGHVGGGQLRIASRLGNTSLPRFDWSYQLSLPGGGFVERDGKFEFEAPIEGYSEDMQISMSATAPGWSSDVTREYFAKLPDGRYARFSINLYPGKRNFIVIESYVNPVHGNRNLEFDPQSPLKLQ